MVPRAVRRRRLSQRGALLRLRFRERVRTELHGRSCVRGQHRLRHQRLLGFGMCRVLSELCERSAVFWQRRLRIRQLHEWALPCAGLRSELQRRQRMRFRLGLRLRRLRKRSLRRADVLPDVRRRDPVRLEPRLRLESMQRWKVSGFGRGVPAYVQ